MQVIYFDNNATTKLDKEVLNKMNEIYQLPINASSIHSLGQKGNEVVETARNNLKELLNANNYEVIFTGTSTEATNTVIQGCMADKILFSAIEHAATYNCRPIGKKIIEFNTLPSGVVDIEDFEKKLNEIEDSNFLVSIMLANSECGTLQPVEKIAKLVHQKGGLIHCDIVQAVGKIEVDLEKLNVDFATISAHKLNGPQGVGALLARKGLEISPLIFGGGQEKSKRAGTTNVAGIAGFGEACKIAKTKPQKYKEVEKLRNYLEEEILKIAGKEVKIFAKEADRIPNTSYIALEYADSQAQVINFDVNGICVSGGSACSSGSAKASRVLKAMKVTPNFIDSAIRVSLSVDNTKEEVDKFIKVWSEFYERHKS